MAARLTNTELSRIKMLRHSHTMAEAAKELGVPKSRVVGAAERYKIRFQKRGEKHHAATYSDRDIELCRELHDEGLSLNEISEKMEIDYFHLWKVINGESR